MHARKIIDILEAGKGIDLNFTSFLDSLQIKYNYSTRGYELTPQNIEQSTAIATYLSDPKNNIDFDDGSDISDIDRSSQEFIDLFSKKYNGKELIIDLSYTTPPESDIVKHNKYLYRAVEDIHVNLIKKNGFNFRPIGDSTSRFSSSRVYMFKSAKYIDILYHFSHSIANNPSTMFVIDTSRVPGLKVYDDREAPISACWTASEIPVSALVYSFTFNNDSFYSSRRSNDTTNYFSELNISIPKTKKPLTTEITRNHERFSDAVKNLSYFDKVNANTYIEKDRAVIKVFADRIVISELASFVSRKYCAYKLILGKFFN